MDNKALDLIGKLSSVTKDIELIEDFKRIRQHYDEPKFWYYSASISDKNLKHDGSHFHSKASGVSFFSQEEAILKALAEAIERYDNFAFFKESVDYKGNYSKVINEAINPKEFIYFSEDQLKNSKFKKFYINDKSVFKWTRMKSLNGSKEVLVPCQAIYLSYLPLKNEPKLYPRISTGAAGHSTLEAAILSGIYEILERDSFMIYYLNRLKPRRYDLTTSNNKKIMALLEIAERYHLEVYVLETKTDLGIPTVATVVVDRSGLSKAISVGLKSDLDVENAIIGSINEAFHTRTWIRESYIQKATSISKKQLIADSSIKNRGLFWYSPDSIGNLDFMLKNLEEVKINQTNKQVLVREQLKTIKSTLAKKGYEIYYKDITSKYFASLPYKTVKVIIPGMQPVFLNEKYPLYGGRRLHDVPAYLGHNDKIILNKYPHPFL